MGEMGSIWVLSRCLDSEKNEKKESESLTCGGNEVRDLGKTGACVGEFKTTP